MINKWLEQTIIGLDLCPFARRPYLEGKILVEELSAQSAAEARISFLNSFNSFQAQIKFETVLLVFPKWKVTFKDFFDFLESCEDLLITLNLEEEFQLVVFHPDFLFEGLDMFDRANLVNSSPLPLIHILKNQDLDLLDLSVMDAEAMSLENGKKLQALTKKELHQHFPWRKI